MVNSQVSNEIVEAFKIDRQVERIPQAIPVIEVGIKSVKNNKAASFARTTTGTASLYASSAINKTYITGLQVSFIKDAACDIATGDINISTTIGGISTIIARFAVITLTADTQSVYIDFKHPLLIDRSATISFTATYAVGLMVRCGTIYYYEDEIN